MKIGGMTCFKYINKMDRAIKNLESMNDFIVIE